MSLDYLKQGFRAYEAAKAQALRVGVCVQCGQLPSFYSEAGRREYGISGMCEPCFDRMFDVTEDEA